MQLFLNPRFEPDHGGVTEGMINQLTCHSAEQLVTVYNKAL